MNRFFEAPKGAVAARAAEFEEIILNHACDGSGIVRTHLFREGLRPLAARDFHEPPDFCPPGVSPPEFIPYEDSGMATGAMLAALSLRAGLTGEARAYRRASRLYGAVRAIYRLGEAREPGFFPKPYGGRCSPQFSRDQYLFALAGLRAYAPLASPQESAEIAEMAAAMAGFWMRHDYKVSHFGQPLASQLDDFMGPIFLGIIGLACELSGEERFFDEYLRIAEEGGLARRSSETLFSLFREGRTYDGGTYLRQNEHSIMMKALVLDRLWEFDPPRLPLWRRALAQFWRDDIPAGVDPADGLQYHILRYDPETGGTCLTEPGPVEGLENPLNYAELTWGGLRKRAGSVQSAFSAFVAASRLGLPEAAAFGSAILSKFEVSSFTGILVPDAAHIPPGKEWEPRLLRTGYTAMWLWAFWMAQSRGVYTGPDAPNVSPSTGEGWISNR